MRSTSRAIVSADQINVRRNYAKGFISSARSRFHSLHNTSCRSGVRARDFYPHDLGAMYHFSSTFIHVDSLLAIKVI
jgi:hypothetical protein